MMMIIIQKKQTKFIYLSFVHQQQYNNDHCKIIPNPSSNNQSTSVMINDDNMFQSAFFVICLVDDYIINTNETLTYCTIYKHMHVNHMMSNKKKTNSGQSFSLKQKKRKTG